MENEACKKIVDLLKQNEYVKILGIEIVELSAGHCKGMMKVSESIKNPYGALHGGSLYSLADIVAGTAACSYGNYVVTVSGNMNFLMPAAGVEQVYCTADVVRQGGHLAVYDVRITDESDKVLENASFTFFVTPNKI